MCSSQRLTLIVLIGIVLGAGSSAPAQVSYHFADDEVAVDEESIVEDTDVVVADDGYYYAPAAIVPNMLGADSLGIPYDNRIVQARLTYQHFLRVSDNNSPIPRDRVAFGYKNYQSVQTAEGGSGQDFYHDIQEFQGRLEKTFLGGMMSAEFILPWAYTTDSNDTGSIVSPPTMNTELGNIGFGLKALLLENGSNYFTAGLLVEAPTADDRHDLLGSYLENEAWYFTPYLATLLQPTENWFVQGFASVRLDGNLNENVGFNRAFSGPDFLMFDLGTGYLLYTGGEGLVRAVTPTVELHYTHSLEEFEAVNPVNPFYRAIGTVDYLTLTTGATAQLGDNSTVALGFLFPLRENNFNNPGIYTGPTDRQFDWAFMVQVNVYRL